VRGTNAPRAARYVQPCFRASSRTASGMPRPPKPPLVVGWQHEWPSDSVRYGCWLLTSSYPLTRNGTANLHKAGRNRIALSGMRRDTVSGRCPGTWVRARIPPYRWLVQAPGLPGCDRVSVDRILLRLRGRSRAGGQEGSGAVRPRVPARSSGLPELREAIYPTTVRWLVLLTSM
jgi:hypothetical protein